MKGRYLGLGSQWLATLAGMLVIGLAASTVQAQNGDVEPVTNWDDTDGSILYGSTLKTEEPPLRAEFRDPDTGDILQGSVTYTLPDEGGLDAEDAGQDILNVNDAGPDTSGIRVKAFFQPDNSDTYSDTEAVRTIFVTRRNLVVNLPQVVKSYGSAAQSFADQIGDDDIRFIGLGFDDTSDAVFDTSSPSVTDDSTAWENVQNGAVGLTPAGTTVNMTYDNTPDAGDLGELANNYEIVYQKGQITIAPKTLDFDIPDSSTQYGAIIDIESNLTGGFENNDADNVNVDVVTDPTIDDLGGEGSADTAVGSYSASVQLSAAADVNGDGETNQEDLDQVLSNYDLSTSGGTHEVVPRELTIAAVAGQAKRYGAENPDFLASFALGGSNEFVLDTVNTDLSGDPLTQSELNDALSGVVDGTITVGGEVPSGRTEAEGGLGVNFETDGDGNITNAPIPYEDLITVSNGSFTSQFAVSRESADFLVDQRPLALQADNKTMEVNSTSLPSTTFSLASLNGSSGPAVGEGKDTILTEDPSLEYIAGPDFDPDNPQDAPVGVHENVIQISGGAVNVNYTIAEHRNGDLEVVKVVPEIVWNPDIRMMPYGDFITTDTLNASARSPLDDESIEGRFIYSAQRDADYQGNPVSGGTFDDGFVQIAAQEVDEEDVDIDTDLGLPAGQYTIRLQFFPSDRDSFEVTDATIDFEVERRALTATVDDVTVNPGDDFPEEFPVVFDGFVTIDPFNDSEDDLDELPTASTSATADSAPDDHDIVVEGGSDQNYAIQTENGTLTLIGQITVAAPQKSRLFGSVKVGDNLAASSTEGLSGVHSADSDTISVSYLVNADDIPEANLIASGDNQYPIVRDARYRIRAVLSDGEGDDETNRLDFYQTEFENQNVQHNKAEATINSRLKVNKAPLTATADDRGQTVKPDGEEEKNVDTSDFTVSLDGLVGPHSLGEDDSNSRTLAAWDTDFRGITDNTSDGNPQGDSINVPTFDERSSTEVAIELTMNSPNYEVTTQDGTYSVSQFELVDIFVLKRDEITYGDEITADSLIEIDVSGLSSAEREILFGDAELNGTASVGDLVNSGDFTFSPPNNPFPAAGTSFNVVISYAAPEDSIFEGFSNAEKGPISVLRQHLVINAQDRTDDGQTETSADDGQVYGEPTPPLEFEIFQATSDWKIEGAEEDPRTGLAADDTEDNVFTTDLVLAIGDQFERNARISTTPGRLRTTQGGPEEDGTYPIIFAQKTDNSRLNNYVIRYNREIDSGDNGIIDGGDDVVQGGTPDANLGATEAFNAGELVVVRRPVIIQAPTFGFEDQGQEPVRFGSPLPSALPEIADIEEFVIAADIDRDGSPDPNRVWWAPADQDGGAGVDNGDRGIFIGDIRAELIVPSEDNITIGDFSGPSASGSPYDIRFTSRVVSENYVVSHQKGQLKISKAIAEINVVQESLTQNVQQPPASTVPVISSTVPAGLDFDVDFEGLAPEEEPPSDVGTYPFTVNIVDANFTGSRVHDGSDADHQPLLIVGRTGLLMADNTRLADGTAKQVSIQPTTDIDISQGNLVVTYARELPDGSFGEPSPAIPASEEGGPFPSEIGTYRVNATLSPTPSLPYRGQGTGTLTIQANRANLLISDTEHQADGNPKEVDVLAQDGAGNELDLSQGNLTVTYAQRQNGTFGEPTTEAPVNPGAYRVEVTLEPTSALPYEAGPKRATMIIRDEAGIEIGDLNPVYDGEPKEVSVSTDPEGLDLAVTYDGGSEPPVNAGTYEVVVTIEDDVFTGTESDELTIQKARAAVLISENSRPFTGEPRPVLVTTEPAGLDVIVTYEGEDQAPTEVGTYEIMMTIDDENYRGERSCTYTITKGEQEIEFPGIADRSVEDSPFDVEVSASSGLDVGLEVVVGPAEVDGKTVTLTGSGTVVLKATQSGNENWNAADPVLRDFEVTGDGGGDTAPVDITVDGDTVTITLNRDADTTYAIDRKESLLDSEWEEVAQIQGDESAEISRDGASNGYFRIRALQ